MNKFFAETKDDLQILCLNTSENLGLSEAVIEKDYWVCFVLDYLFHKSKWKDAFTFKGGTSLSKCFKLIERFSEDIDLILDWRVLGYAKDEPWENRTNTGQDKFNKKINVKTEYFILLGAEYKAGDRQPCSLGTCYKSKNRTDDCRGVSEYP
jgi:hypothetical protein